jgi:hypothetical protein
MNLARTLFSTIAATAILALGAPTLRAQTPPRQPVGIHAKIPAYYITEFEITDPEGIKSYGDQVDATFTSIASVTLRALYKSTGVKVIRPTID